MSTFISKQYFVFFTRNEETRLNLLIINKLYRDEIYGSITRVYHIGYMAVQISIKDGFKESDGFAYPLTFNIKSGNEWTVRSKSGVIITVTLISPLLYIPLSSHVTMYDNRPYLFSSPLIH